METTNTLGPLLSENSVSETRQKLRLFFKEKGMILQEEIGEGGRQLYPQDEVAKKLSISIGQLRKKIYGLRPISRDWLIALCAAYGLDASDTCDAMEIKDMPRLDDGIEREKIISEYLDAHRFNPSSVDALNELLSAKHLPTIDIEKHKGKEKKEAMQQVSSKYTVVGDAIIRAFENPGDRYNSISTRYLPNQLCVAMVKLEDPEKRQYSLEAYSNGSYTVYSLVDNSFKVYPTIDETGDFLPFFLFLSKLLTKTKNELDLAQFDSRNFQGRVGANIKNDKIHIFYEVFNYTYPERNEYYLMEYVDETYQLSVSHKSMFMQEYLSSKEFFQHFSSKDIMPRKTYSSIDEIETLIHDQHQPYFYPALYKSRKAAYSSLKERVSEALEDIKNKRIFINNLSYIFDNPYDVLRYYGIEKQFECSYDEEFDEINACLNEVIFLDSEGNNVLLTFDDITQAFELGFENIDQVIRVKSNTGSITSILK